MPSQPKKLTTDQKVSKIVTTLDPGRFFCPLCSREREKKHLPNWILENIERIICPFAAYMDYDFICNDCCRQRINHMTLKQHMELSKQIDELKHNLKLEVCTICHLSNLTNPFKYKSQFNRGGGW